MLQRPDGWLLLAAAALAFGYLCGSIPFGLILTRLAGTADIRSIGSGNIGATNVLRTGRKGLAAATLLGDALKGTLAVLVVEQFWGRELAILAALIASAATPVLLWSFGKATEAELFALLTVLTWIMHRANIARLVQGTEG